jgi:hypothetical protein
MPEKAPLSLLLLTITVMTGCGETEFGPNGAIPVALHRDMVNVQRKCRMSDPKWLERCGMDYWFRSPRVREACPVECRPDKP